MILVGLLCAICAGVPSFFVGGLVREMQIKVARGNGDVAHVEEIREAHPDEFGSLTINRGPGDKFHLEGTVETQDDLDLLEDKVVRSLGEDRADFVLRVTVEPNDDSGE